nr:aldo/keto reductase [Sphingobium sp. Sx8-8]
MGFGAGTLGNLYRPVSDEAARAALEAALGAGMRYIDTAPHYGRGLSERRVGDSVRLRPDVIVSTKVGRLMLPDGSITDDRERDGFRSPMPFRKHYDYSHDGILRSHEDSLQRLGLDHVDILYVHDIGSLTHGERHAFYWEQLTKGGGLKALERLRAEGTVAAVGIGVNEIAVCMDVMREIDLDAILLAGRYTLLEQSAMDELLPACALAGTSIIVGGPYNSGILATGTRGGGMLHYDYETASEEVVNRVRLIEDVAERYGVPLPAAALQFVLAHPQVVCVLPGLGSAERVEATIRLYRQVIPEAFWAELYDRRLVRSDAPMPGGSA